MTRPAVPTMPFRTIVELRDQVLRADVAERTELLQQMDPGLGRALTQECGSTVAFRREAGSLREIDRTGGSVGGWSLEEIIARGGGGVIYLARGLRGVAALKMARRVRPEELAAVRREIVALAAVEHPGVVQILDDGLEEGLPWYAMELVDGPSLRTRIPSSDEAGTEPAIRFALQLTQRMCAPLSALHGAGLVHRDLKPENVLLRSGDRPCLVDFGLMARHGGADSRESLDASGGWGGTMAYIAPEQGEGGLVDARADLYSLGCILYELLTGLPPFAADSPALYLWLHSHATPETPSRVRPGIPPAVDELVLRLLEKDPRDRFGYATDLATAMAPLLDGGLPEDLCSTSHLYRPGLAGREDLLKPLLGTVTKKYADRSLALIAGGPGTGKTRLALELMSRARRAGCLVQAGDCQPRVRTWGGGRSRPLGAFRQVLVHIADRCLEGGEGYTRDLFDEIGGEIGHYEPRLRQLPGIPPSLPPEKLAEGRSRVVTAMVRLLERLALTAPVVVVLDDLQWADDLSLEVLDHWLRTSRPPKHPALMVGLYRPGEAAPVLERLAALSEVTAATLGPLEDEDLVSIVSDMLALEEADDLARSVAAGASGSPFYAAEYLRTCRDSGLLSRSPDGTWRLSEAGPVPGLSDLLVTRIEAQSQPAQSVLTMAAVLGRDVSESDLVGICGPEARSVVGELLDAHLLEQAAVGHLRFPHQQLRELVLIRAGSALGGLHARAAAYLEERDDDGLLSDIVAHWEAAGDTEKVSQTAARAARIAVTLADYDEAGRLYRLALEAGSDEADRLELELAKRVDIIQGRADIASESLRRLSQQAAGRGDRAMQTEALIGLAAAVRNLGDLQGAASILSEALDLMDDATDPVARASAMNDLGNILRMSGDVEGGHRWLEEAQRVAASTDDTILKGRILGNLALAEKTVGALERAVSRYEEAREMFRRAGDRFFESRALESIGMAYRDEGRLEEAVHYIERSRSLDRQLGCRRSEGNNALNLSLVYHDRKQRVEARKALVQALEALEETGDRGMQGQALLNLGLLDQQEGNRVLARERFEGARRIFMETGRLTQRIDAETRLAALDVVEGHLEEARTRIEEARTLSVSPAWRLRLDEELAVIAECQGRNEEALQLWDRVLSQAEAIDKRTFRRNSYQRAASFLLSQGELDRAGDCLERVREIEDIMGVTEAGRVSRLLAESRLARLQGDQDRAIDLADEVLRILGAIEAPAEEEVRHRVSALVARGRARAAASQDASEDLILARALLERLPPGIFGGLREKVERLAAAVKSTRDRE